MENKKVLIIGSASGIGRASADKFLSCGYSVFGVDVKQQSPRDNFYSYTADIRDYNALIKIKEENLSNESFDIILTCAGVHTMASLVEGNIDEIKRLLDINLLGTVNSVRAFHSLLAEQGRIIIVTSEVATYTPMPFNGLYNISKTALECYADALRQELNLIGQRVITVRPGSTDTPLAEGTESSTEALVRGTELYKDESAHFCGLVRKFKGTPIPPETIAGLVYKISKAKHPRLSYSKHRSLGLVFLNLLPKRLQLAIIKLILKSNVKGK